MGGVEYSFAIANWVVGVPFVMNTQQWELLPVFILIHFLLKIASSREPEIRKVYRRYSGQGDQYDPFPKNMGGKSKNERPEEWGRNVPC